MIVNVKKVRLVALKEQKESLLKALQKTGDFMLFNHEENPTLHNEDQSKLKQIETIIEALSAYEKNKLFAFHEVTNDEFEGKTKEAEELIAVVDSALKKIEELGILNTKLREELTKITPFENLPIATNDLKLLHYTKIDLGLIPLGNFIEFNEKVNALGFIFEESTRSLEFVFGALGYEYTKSSEAAKLMNAYRYEATTLPAYSEKLSTLIPVLNKQISDNDAEIAELTEKLKLYGEKVGLLKTYYDFVYNAALRKTVGFNKTEKTVYLDGWVKEEDIELFTKQLTEQVACDVDVLETPNDELVPTALKNNWFVRQFETITNMFSVPHPQEFDPNPIMSFWYWLIFGIMMGDIGYGLVMIVVFLLFVKLARPKGELRKLALIFAFSGVSSIIFGVLFGSFFGVDVDLLQIVGSWFGNPNLTSVVLQPVADPLPMLIFSLVLGALHIMTALVIKFVTEIRRKNILGALADGLSWFLVLLGAGLAIVVKPALVGIIIAGVGLLLILFLAGHENEKLTGKILGGLGGLYNITGYLSDILSYSRILALSLSTAVIAFTMNLLAGMVSGSVIGVFFAILIYIVGHLFNFVMGLLSAYVHDGRLQYLEYFGKFYDGGGYLFTPFEYKLKYIDEIKKENE
ncbi:MAG TPA: V-type ATP synthase subunit I [Bacilli bacterium]|nr:V-type ATP synthase subunit I [Bacilli bacterium]